MAIAILDTLAAQMVASMGPNLALIVSQTVTVSCAVSLVKLSIAWFQQATGTDYEYLGADQARFDDEHGAFQESDRPVFYDEVEDEYYEGLTDDELEDFLERQERQNGF